MRNPGGYYVGRSVDLDGRTVVVERDTFTCVHCNRVVFVRPMCDPVEMGGRCTCCDALICRACAERGVCDHIENKLARLEAVRSYV